MKKILLALAFSTATAAFGQGYVLFENTIDSSCYGVCLNQLQNGSFAGPGAVSGTFTVALLWYNGTNFQQIAVYPTPNLGPHDAYFFYDGAVTIPTYAPTGTFIIQGWTGTNFSNYAAAVAGGALVGETPAFFNAESSTDTNLSPDYILDSGYFGSFTTYAYVDPNGHWTGNLLLSSNTPPAIAGQPVSTNTVVGTNLTLYVTPTYQNVTYQWQFNGTNIAGAMRNVLNFTNIQPTNAGTYTVILNNPLGTVVSAPAVVSVGPPDAPSIYVNSSLAAVTASAVVSASISFVSGFTNGFVFYTLDGSTPTNSSTLYNGPFTLTNSATIQAIGYSSDFSQTATMQPLALTITPPFTISISLDGEGSVSLNPNTNEFAGNSLVTLAATPATNWVFAEWLGDINSTNNPVNVTVNSNLTIEAVFLPSYYGLLLTTPGGGTVTANGQSYTNLAYFPTNSVVTLAATPSSGWTFAGWQEGVNSTNNPYYLQMTGPYLVTGVFQTVLQTNAVGWGQIVLNPGNPFNYGDTVTASAVPSNGNYFVAWSGIASGTNSPVTATVTNTEIDALFAALPANKLSLSVVLLGNGAVNINPPQSYYNYGDQVTLTATWNAPAYSFNGWSGAVNDSNSTTVATVTTNMVVYANFSSIARPTLGLVMSPQGPILQIGGLQGQGNEIIYTSTDLTNWQPISTTAPVTGSFYYIDTNASNVPFRYYRVAVQ